MVCSWNWPKVSMVWYTLAIFLGTRKSNTHLNLPKKGEKLDVIVLEVDKDNRRLSLGHKQLEENPWETFETIFTLGTVHEGTVISHNDKGATIQLQYGVEAFAPARHMKKADNKPVKDDETLEFEVIEFSKDSKRIIVSHTNVWKGAEKATKEADVNSKEKARKNASKAVKKINQTSEKTTLGELGALAELRAQLEKQENAPAEKPAKAKETKKVEPVETTETEGNNSLKSLSGVGPAMEKRIVALGINSLNDLKSLTEEAIAANVEKDSKISADQWNKWIAEANSL